MRYQAKDSSYCGPTALQNALQVYGHKVSSKKILKATDSLPDLGTNEFQLIQGLREFGYEGIELRTDSRDIAFSALRVSGVPWLLCIHTDEPWDHWVCVLHLQGLDRYILWDSENSVENKRENGTHIITQRQLQNRWAAPARAQVDWGDFTYYGIVVRKVKQ